MSVDSEQEKVFSDEESTSTSVEVKTERLGNTRTRKTVLRKHVPNRAEKFFRSC